MRSYTREHGSYYDLNDPLLQLLHLNLESLEKHDKLGLFKNIFSVFTFPNDNCLRYYVHPELVECKSPDTFQIYICSSCICYLKKGLFPKYSIANGFDFGRMKRIPHLKPLTIVEIYLIAHIRLYLTEFKLVAKGKKQYRFCGIVVFKGSYYFFSP